MPTDVVRRTATQIAAQKAGQAVVDRLLHGVSDEVLASPRRVAELARRGEQELKAAAAGQILPEVWVGYALGVLSTTLKQRQNLLPAEIVARVREAEAQEAAKSIKTTAGRRK
jgi:hypothetical protein